MKIFSCHMPHAQSRQTVRVWGFFELFPFWKQLVFLYSNPLKLSKILSFESVALSTKTT